MKNILENWKIKESTSNNTAGNSGFKKWRGSGFIRNWKGFKLKVLFIFVKAWSWFIATS